MSIRVIFDLLRLNKPTGTLLLFLPCSFGVALNARCAEDFLLLVPFLIGSFAMRSAGCIVNDIWDKDFDIVVARTKTRAIAAGHISVKSAILICMFFCCLGLLVLMSFSFKAILFSLLSVPLFIIYPLMKRYTFFPQTFLGMTFNFGILIASIQLQGEITPSSLILYIGTIFWTMGYDSIYGFMDIHDDKKIGIKSLSILIEKWLPKFWLSLFYGVFISSLYLIAYSIKEKLGFYQLLFIILIIAHFLWQIMTLKLKSSNDCMKKFKSNILVGALVFGFLTSL